MKRSLLLICAIPLFLVAPARAGINLSWDDCGTSGASRQEFACNTNTGAAFNLIGSITPSPSTTAEQVVGASATIAVLGTQAQLPDWWKFGFSECRGSAALSVTFDFQEAGPYTCVDPWVTRAQGWLTYEIVSPMNARIRLSTALPQGETVALESGTEYYIFKVRIARSRSTGTGACAGCSAAACLLLEHITLFQPVELANDPIDTNPQDNNVATWHGAYVFIWHDREHGQWGIGCAPDQPTRAGRSTWGAVKSLYR